MGQHDNSFCAGSRGQGFEPRHQLYILLIERKEKAKRADWRREATGMNKCLIYQLSVHVSIMEKKQAVIKVFSLILVKYFAIICMENLTKPALLVTFATCAKIITKF